LALADAHVETLAVGVTGDSGETSKRLPAVSAHFARQGNRRSVLCAQVRIGERATACVARAVASIHDMAMTKEDVAADTGYYTIVNTTTEPILVRQVGTTERCGGRAHAHRKYAQAREG